MLLFFAGAICYTLPACRRPWLFVVTLSALIISAVTDFLDGHLARKLQVVTPLGAHADPLMDKFFYLASLPLLVFTATLNKHREHAILLLVLTLLFLLRDQWVTFLRSIGALHNISGGAHWSGKLRTAFAFPLICAIYYYEEAPAEWQFIAAPWIYGLETAGIVITLLSVYSYTRRYWEPLKRTFNTEGGAE